MGSDNKKGVDEVFCTSCGEIIKKKAKICPNCGVANENRQSTSSTQTRSNHTLSNTDNSQSSNSPHNPQEYETSVSNRWGYGIAVGIVLWTIGFVLPEASPVAGLFLLSGWILMPVSVYFDKQWIQATTKWKPELLKWIILTSIPVVNLVAGSIYLVRRHNEEQISTPTKSKINSDSSIENKAVIKLREKYVDGKLSEEEFEQELEYAMEGSNK